MVCWPTPFGAALNFRNQFAILDQNNASLPFTAGTFYGTVDRTFTDSISHGATLQVTGNAPLLGLGNYFTAGFSVGNYLVSTEAVISAEIADEVEQSTSKTVKSLFEVLSNKYVKQLYNIPGFVLEKVLDEDPQTQGIQVEAFELPYEGAAEFVPRVTERAMARIFASCASRVRLASYCVTPCVSS